MRVVSAAFCTFLHVTLTPPFRRLPAPGDARAADVTLVGPLPVRAGARAAGSVPHPVPPPAGLPAAGSVAHRRGRVASTAATDLAPLAAPRTRRCYTRLLDGGSPAGPHR
jgi:hypothetical protein